MKVKGLKHFIKDVNSQKSGVSTDERIKQELFKIKKKKKKKGNLKSVFAKMCFIQLLGYDLNFGLKQIKHLLKSKDSSENFFGWLALSIIVHNEKDVIASLLSLIIQKFH